MISTLTAELFSAFIYGSAALLGGGVLFEAGKRYVKTAGSHQFKGKIEAIPFFFSVLVLGWVIQVADPVIENIVYGIPTLTRLGMMTFGSMVLFNYSVEYFRYTDPKSVLVYIIGLSLIFLPML